MKNNYKWNSYFKEINWSIKEININGMINVKQMVKEELNKDIVKIFKIMKPNPRIFRIELDDKTVLRFEIMPAQSLHLIKLHELSFLYHDGTPEVIFYKVIGNKIFKFSEWIHGKLVSEVKHLEKVNVKIGEMLAKLNNIQDPKTGLFITNGEISMSNLIWTKDEKVFVIDHDRLRAVKENNLDEIVLKNMVKRIQYKDRIDMFLDGYSKYRDITGILKIANERNWTWGKRKLRTP
jgi:hypothetical protein